MEGPSLPLLPLEVLQKIFIALDPSSALALGQTCRHIRHAGNDWTVWRDIICIQHDIGYSSSLVLACYHDRDVWKRYIIADVRASQLRPITRKDVEQWLPHILSLHRPISISIDTTALHQLCDSICNGLQLYNTNQLTHDCIPCPTSSFDITTWRFAQAASFCLSLQLLSNSTTVQLGDDKPPILLPSVLWFRLTSNRGEYMPTEEPAKHIIMLHALANRAVGFFVTQLRWALANGATASRSTTGLFPPPTVSTLPFESLLAPPVPFTLGSLEQFSQCHLSAMTKPGFYTDDEWTGYTSMTPGDNSHAWVDGFGGGHPDLSTVDRTIRFHLFEQSNMLKYTLTSEFKRTQFSNFKVTVDRATGHLKLCWTDSLKKSCYTVDAVITPFGIVGRRTSYGNWIWLWKCKWSEYDMIV